MHQRLVLYHLPRPAGEDLKEEIYWLCDTLGLSSGRDLDNLSTRIILQILENSFHASGISSDQLGQLLEISSGRVNHHLRNLSRAGIIYRERRLIHLRGRSLRDSIREIRRDAERIFDELESVAEEIDARAGVQNNREEGTSLVLTTPSMLRKI